MVEDNDQYLAEEQIVCDKQPSAISVVDPELLKEAKIYLRSILSRRRKQLMDAVLSQLLCRIRFMLYR